MNVSNDVIRDLVHDCYWTHDINCAGTTLRALSKLHDFTLAPQVLDASVGMHGAGGFRAQCGLVEGALMFMGVYFTAKGLCREDVAALCKGFAVRFAGNFGALTCEILRPGGFNPDDEPHLCEKLSARGICFAHEFILKAESGNTAYVTG